MDRVLSKTSTVKKPAFALRLWRGPFPQHLVASLEEAVRAMHKDSYVDSYMTEKGFVDHTWEGIMAAFGGQSECWVALQDGKVVGFLLAAYSKEIDNEPTFIIKQAWVHPIIRRTPRVKEMLGTILYNAKANLAKHVLIVSSRNPRSYLRWLGKGWSPISTVLKGDL